MILDNIVKLCAEKNISIAKLEAEAGLGNATIRRWKESSPNLSSLQAVADVLDVTVADLLKKE